MSIVFFGWIIFRSDSLSYAVTYIKIMFGHLAVAVNDISFSWRYYLDNKYIVILIFAIFGAMILPKTKIYGF
jgi:D-alanyl-lipoteichoic acid acyltransferase DltB (MBOAT superfamily)